MGSLGKVKVDDVIRIPAAVKRYFDLEEGDFLEFWPGISFSDSTKGCIVLTVEKKAKKGRKR